MIYTGVFMMSFATVVLVVATGASGNKLHSFKPLELFRTTFPLESIGGILEKGDDIYVTTTDGLNVYIRQLSAETGKEERSVFLGTQNSALGRASSIVSLDNSNNKTILVTSTEEGLLAYNIEPFSLLWQDQFIGPVANGCLPKVLSDRSLVTTATSMTGTLVARTTEMGENLWTYWGGTGVRVCAIVSLDETRVYFTEVSKQAEAWQYNIVALDTATGQIADFSQSPSHGDCSQSPSVSRDGKILYVYCRLVGLVAYDATNLTRPGVILEEQQQGINVTSEGSGWNPILVENNNDDTEKAIFVGGLKNAESTITRFTIASGKGSSLPSITNRTSAGSFRLVFPMKLSKDGNVLFLVTRSEIRGLSTKEAEFGLSERDSMEAINLTNQVPTLGIMNYLYLNQDENRMYIALYNLGNGNGTLIAYDIRTATIAPTISPAPSQSASPSAAPTRSFAPSQHYSNVPTWVPTTTATSSAAAPRCWESVSSNLLFLVSHPVFSVVVTLVLFVF